MRLFSKRKKKSSYEGLFISREAYEAIRGELEKEIENLTDHQLQCRIHDLLYEKKRRLKKHAEDLFDKDAKFTDKEASDYDNAIIDCHEWDVLINEFEMTLGLNDREAITGGT